MRTTLLNRLAVAIAAGAVAGCVAGGGAPPPLPALAADRDAPVLALFEHVLTGYFAGTGAHSPTTCAEMVPRNLTADQEQALIVRFVRLAPLERCVSSVDGEVDSITGESAEVVQVSEFSCPTRELCSGLATISGAEWTRYAMRFENGAWRVTGDAPALAE